MTDHGAITVSLTVLYVITMVVALAGNTLLIYILWKKPGARNVTSFLFVNMAVADLLIAVMQIPFSITDLYISGTLLEGFRCRFFCYVVYVSMTASIFCLTVMAFDRYFAVVHPFRRSIWFRKPKIITPIIWISAMALMSIAPVAIKLGRYGRCWIEKSLVFPLYTLFFGVGFLLPLVVISTLYILVARKLWLHKVPVDHNVRENQREQEIPKKKVIRMLIIVVVVFVVCWLPLHIYYMSEAVSLQMSGNGVMWKPYVIIYIFYWLSQANSAINPWLYIGLNGKIKAAFRNMILRRHEEITAREQPTLALTTRSNRVSSSKNSMMEAKL